MLQRTLKHLIFLFCLFVYSIVPAQNVEAANDLVREGVVLHDQQEYEEALAKYDAALELDTANFYALAEKTVTLFHLGRTEDCVALSERILSTHGAHDEIGMVYIAYANSLDHAKRPEEALKVYTRGQEIDPGNYQLWFNEAITLIGMERYDEAIDRLQRSLALNPGHGSSHNALGRLMLQKKQRIPALLALSSFLIIEPEGPRADLALPLMVEQLKGSVETNKKGGITIYVDAADLPKEGDTTNVADSFYAITMLIDLLGASDLGLSKKKEKRTELEQLTDKFNFLCGMLANKEGKEHGFFWEYYAPYFNELNEAGHGETAMMIMHASSGDAEVDKWLKKNPEAIDSFYKWSSEHEWVK